VLDGRRYRKLQPKISHPLAMPKNTLKASREVCRLAVLDVQTNGENIDDTVAFDECRGASPDQQLLLDHLFFFF